MTQLAASFAVKGLLILMTSSSVATGLTHLYSSFDLIKCSAQMCIENTYAFNEGSVFWCKAHLCQHLLKKLMIVNFD